MCLDRLDGRIDAAFFDQMSADWRRQQRELQAQAEQTIGLRSATEAVGLMRQVSEACAGFDEQPMAQKRTLISAVVKSASWKGGELRTVLADPYAVLAHPNSASERKEGEKLNSG